MKSTPNILIMKASGEKEAFDVSKLKNSLHRAGANNKSTDLIVGEILDWLYDGVTTKKIYSKAFSLLKSQSHLNALRYSLKQALLEMGPSGFPFEQLLGEIYRRLNYDVQVNVMMEGRCVTHEMDMIATKNNTQILCECKYSKDQGKTVSVQVPLYVHSRIEDILKIREKESKYENYSFSGLIATNTRFTVDSIQYAKCVGLELLSWDYPSGNGLKDLLERENVFPITILENLTQNEKTEIMEKKIVSCRQLFNNLSITDSFEMTNAKRNKLVTELEDILSF